MIRTALSMVASLVFIFAISSVVALAEESRGDQMKKLIENTTPAERADVQTNIMMTALSPNEVQGEQISAVNLKYAKKAGEIFSSEGSRFSKFRKMNKLLNDKDKELETILSNEQFKAYEEIKKEIGDRTMDLLQQQ